MRDGQPLFFDGRLWHYSHNVSRLTRQALLLQYATPDTVMRIPDPDHLDWPFRVLHRPRPACVMLRGSDTTGINRIVPAPMPGGLGWSTQLTSRIYPLGLPLPAAGDSGWTPHPLFSGSTADVRSMSCHASVLTPGRCPHPPHRHDEEELLLLLAGEVELVLPDASGDQRRRLRSGECVYYPARFTHTLETVGGEPANYLMFKWAGDGTSTRDPLLGFGRFDLSGATDGSGAEGTFHVRDLFAGPTAFLRTLHGHVSTLAPGSGYDPHIDAYDVAIVMLEGECETLGERVGPHSVIFYPAGEPHGMRNSGAVAATYVVFEFHGSQTALAAALPAPRPSLFLKLTDPRRWRRKFLNLARRVIRRP
jgi:mannose-6-phosphate isomerase-like protein (cupin superfamily)